MFLSLGHYLEERITLSFMLKNQTREKKMHFSGLLFFLSVIERNPPSVLLEPLLEPLCDMHPIYLYRTTNKTLSRAIYIKVKMRLKVNNFVLLTYLSYCQTL